MNIQKFRSVYYKMVQRVQGKTKIPSDIRNYSDCTVSEVWMSSGDFVQWAERVTYYEPGWQLDKDILYRGNRVYGPDTCVFVPQEINKLLIKADTIRGEYPIGVKRHHKKIQGTVL